MENMGNETMHRRPIVILLVIAVVLAGAIIWIGNWAIKQEAGMPPPGGLTDAEKAEILASLQRPPNTPPLTEAEKAEILKSLQQPPNTPPLTEAEQAEILKSLQ